MKRWALPFAVFWAQILLSAFVYQKLPRPGATGTTRAFVLFLGTPALTLVGFVFYHLLAKKMEARKSDTLAIVWILTFFFGVHALVLAMAIGLLKSLQQAMPIAVSILLVGLGPVMAQLEPNSAMGIRTKATLSSAVAWGKVHRLLGGLFPIAGALGLSALWLEGWTLIAAAVVPAFVALLIGVVYGLLVRV
jgi:uncharacterized membrane protein